MNAKRQIGMGSLGPIPSYEVDDYCRRNLMSWGDERELVYHLDRMDLVYRSNALGEDDEDEGTEAEAEAGTGITDDGDGSTD